VIAVRHEDHDDRWLVDYTLDLAGMETLTGSPTHVAEGLTLTPEGLVDGTKARVRVTGGTHGRTYQIKTTATTSNSRTLVNVWPYRVFNG
jgi:hypothetical protein